MLSLRLTLPLKGFTLPLHIYLFTSTSSHLPLHNLSYRLLHTIYCLLQALEPTVGLMVLVLDNPRLLELLSQ